MLGRPSQVLSATEKCLTFFVALASFMTGAACYDLFF